MKEANKTGSISKLKGNRRRPYVLYSPYFYDSISQKYKRSTLGYFSTLEEAKMYKIAYFSNNINLLKSNNNIDSLTFEEVYKLWLENKDVVDYFDYNYKGNDLKIPYHDILYIETTGVSHKLRIIGKNFAKEFYGTMADIQEKDKDTQRFYSAHKSFLVNVGNIREIDRKNLEVVFYEDHRCPITRLKVRKLRDILEKKSKK